MNKKRLDELWEQVVHIGTIDGFDDDRMMALGSVFGEMRSEIEKLMLQNNRLQEVFDTKAEVHDKLNADHVKSRNENKRYREQLELIRSDTFIKREDFVSVKHLIRKRAEKALEGETND